MLPPHRYTESPTVKAKESQEAHIPEGQMMLEAEESPETHTPEEQQTLEASGTTDSAIGNQDRTDVK